MRTGHLACMPMAIGCRTMIKDDELIAAVDLGSNSFRLEISKIHGEHIQRVEYLKETVRQGAGLDAEGHLTPEAMDRGWQCLARFGERLQSFPGTHVRALATQTLREARNKKVFLAEAERLLGHPIEVISGQEEARLIYQGVTYFLPQNPEEYRTVIDIGGRSTEVIVGLGETPLEAVSFPLGSVSWSQRFFGDGKLSAKAFHKAEIAATALLEERFAKFDNYPREYVLGASGTMNAVAQALLQLELAPVNTVTRKALAILKTKLIEAQHIDKLSFAGLREDRKPVIGGGISVLTALLDMLQADTLHISEGALRQGALIDLIRREQPHDRQSDIREKSVQSLLKRFGHDEPQGTRIAETATRIWQAWGMDTEQEEALQQVQWAAQLHEIGISIAYERYHHHGAYIFENGDCPGFLPSERTTIAQLILGHKGKLKKVPALAQSDSKNGFFHQLLCLRLAVLLCNARKDPDMQSLQWSAPKARSAKISVTESWSQQYPQSFYLLQEEVGIWEKVGFELSLSVAA